MERHGSESYFVIGEGLLGESLGGRRSALTAAGEAVPQFRFSRMGPKGAGKQLGEPNRRKIAEAMTVANLSPGQIPAGFTYLGLGDDSVLVVLEGGAAARKRGRLGPACQPGDRCCFESEQVGAVLQRLHRPSFRTAQDA